MIQTQAQQRQEIWIRRSYLGAFFVGAFLFSLALNNVLYANRSLATNLGALGINGSIARPAIIEPPLPALPEPEIVQSVGPDEARAINNTVPFISGPNPAALPFRFVGTDPDREMAKSCLASAALYEAGADKVGQEAVVQVVLNRLRHPAFPKTICGVVFQGSERATGCQFTFTCDHSLERIPSREAWQAARVVAESALSGFVMKAVGTATHYHTDWVVPYWSSSLDKLAQVHTQIFYRWQGWWGKPAAFTGKYAGGEVIDPRIRGLADQHLIGASAQSLDPSPTNQTMISDEPAKTLALEGLPPTALKGAVVKLVDVADNLYVLDLSSVRAPGDFALAALNICATKTRCSVLGWSNPAQMPVSFPINGEALQLATFRYEKDNARSLNIARWNCAQIPRADSSQCLNNVTALERDAAPTGGLAAT